MNLVKIEEDFVASWDAIELRYAKYFPPALNIIRTLRSKGYDKNLRAGTALHDLILSRAKNHGLITQHSYVFRGYENKEEVYQNFLQARKENKINHSWICFDFTGIINRENAKLGIQRVIDDSSKLTDPELKKCQTKLSEFNKFLDMKQVNIFYYYSGRLGNFFNGLDVYSDELNQILISLLEEEIK